MKITKYYSLEESYHRPVFPILIWTPPTRGRKRTWKEWHKLGDEAWTKAEKAGFVTQNPTRHFTKTYYAMKKLIS